jgi:hypothetical protein
VDCRREPEENSSEQGDPEREEENTRIQCDPPDVGKNRSVQTADRKHCPGANGQSHRTSNQRKQQTFSQKLADRPPPARPERCSDGHFFLTRRASRKQQVRDIRAGNQENNSDRCHENQERRPNLPDQLFAKRDHKYVPPHTRPVVGRGLSRELLCEKSHLRGSLSQIHASFQPSDHLPAMRATISWMSAVKRQRSPDLIVARKIESIW